MSKTQIMGALATAGVALLAFAVVAYTQRKVIAVPIVGDYLPK